MKDRILTPRPPLRSGEGELGEGSYRERVVQNPFVEPEKAFLARRLRRFSTSAEVAAWEMLRDRRMLGLKFRRQQVFRGFILDFYCAEHRLAIELDGPVHDRRMELDRARDEALRLAGVTTLRLRNHELSEARLESELRKILLPLSGTERGLGGEDPF